MPGVRWSCKRIIFERIFDMDTGVIIALAVVGLVVIAAVVIAVSSVISSVSAAGGALDDED